MQYRRRTQETKCVADKTTGRCRRTMGHAMRQCCNRHGAQPERDGQPARAHDQHGTKEHHAQRNHLLQQGKLQAGQSQGGTGHQCQHEQRRALPGALCRQHPDRPQTDCQHGQQVIEPQRMDQARHETRCVMASVRLRATGQHQQTGGS